MTIISPTKKRKTNSSAKFFENKPHKNFCSGSQEHDRKWNEIKRSRKTDDGKEKKNWSRLF